MIRLIIKKGKKPGIETLVPEQWNELNQEQVSGLASILIVGSSDSLKNKIAIARILLSLDDKTFFSIDPGVIVENIIPLCGWVEKSNTLTDQLIPILNISSVQLYGPASELGNLRLVEWDFSERILDAWIKNPEGLELLAEMAAVLYRPAKEKYDFIRNPDGDARITFNDNLIHYYSKLILEQVPVNTLLAIMLWYRGCRELIIENYKIVFSSGNKKKSKSDPGYFDLMRAIAKEGTYGDFDKVEQMYLLNALQELKCSKDEAEAIKANSKNKAL